MENEFVRVSDVTGRIEDTFLVGTVVCNNVRTGFAEATDDRGPDAFGSASNQNGFVREIVHCRPVGERYGLESSRNLRTIVRTARNKKQIIATLVL